jgi:Ca-activated chloride channel family protein
MAEDLVRPERITRVILLSDGVANVGNTGSGSILEEVQRYVDRGITLSTVGFGMGNYNDVLMERLANDGDGNYAYVDTLDQARRVFVEDLTGTLQVIAKDAKIQVIFNPEVVRRYRLLGYEDRRVADEDFRDDSVDGGGIGAGHSVTALYELEFHEGAQGLATEVFVRYQDPDRHQPIEASRSFSRENFVPAFDQASPRFQLAATVAEYAEVLRESDFAQGSSLKAVNELAERVGRLIPDDPDIAEFIRLTGRAE